MRLRPPLLLLAGATVAAAVIAAPGSASATPAAASAPKVTVLDRTVVAPYQLAHDNSSVYVADGGRSAVSKLTSQGPGQGRITARRPGEVAGVAINGKGTLAYTVDQLRLRRAPRSPSSRRTARPARSTSDLRADPQPGQVDPVRHRQPDRLPAGRVRAARRGHLPGSWSTPTRTRWPRCRMTPGWSPTQAATTCSRSTRTAGSAVVSVLPRQPSTITAEAAAGLGLPDCVVGAVYNFEAVPTDVEVAANGRLIVSLLPGGPEDPSLGARGSVVSVNPRNGNATKLATGLLGGTNVALGPDGKIFVLRAVRREDRRHRARQGPHLRRARQPARPDLLQGRALRRDARPHRRAGQPHRHRHAGPDQVTHGVAPGRRWMRRHGRAGRRLPSGVLSGGRRAAARRGRRRPG